MWQPGTTFQNYLILELPGQGGMGTVFLAWDQNYERKVALKVIHPVLANDVQVQSRFDLEADILAQLSHPGIVDVYAFTQHQGQSILVLEYIEGNRLDSLVERSGPLSWQVAIPFFLKILKSVEYAHVMKELKAIGKSFKKLGVCLKDEGDHIIPGCSQ